MTDSEKQFDAWWINAKDNSDLLVSHSDAWDIWNEAQSVLGAQSEQHRVAYQKIIDGLKQELFAAKVELGKFSDRNVYALRQRAEVAEAKLDAQAWELAVARNKVESMRNEITQDWSPEVKSLREHLAAARQSRKRLVVVFREISRQFEMLDKLATLAEDDYEAAEQRAATLAKENAELRVQVETLKAESDEKQTYVWFYNLLNSGQVKGIANTGEEFFLTWWNDDTDELELSHKSLKRLLTAFGNFMAGDKTYAEIETELAVGAPAEGKE